MNTVPIQNKIQSVRVPSSAGMQADRARARLILLRLITTLEYTNTKVAA